MTQDNQTPDRVVEWDFTCDRCGKGFNSLDALGWHWTARCNDTKWDYPKPNNSLATQPPNNE